ncbi:hypothetical protein [Turneriella parva]|uniref:Uncharacterized protein n=1 Tax=Turneriella parva (strain ATCC BAA-1111 / DSM 21527 / NCTC 11395 / H) TaxID=869212 RepID=I4B6Z8_TURPD|nr:hypothetical protein [Turneriella parva]AFM13055.1 hypothetical protein Turpa_2413 [Turneriella parva DSM 21527]
MIRPLRKTATPTIALIMCGALLMQRPLAAQRKSSIEPYQNPFAVKTHVDGSPLLIDGRFEFYMFPGARRERTPDRQMTCGERIAVTTVNVAAQLIRSAVRRR